MPDASVWNTSPVPRGPRATTLRRLGPMRLHADSSGRHSALAWPFHPAFIPLWYAGIAWGWWKETLAQLEAAEAAGADAGAAAAPALMASIALPARLLASLSEAGLYTLWWRGRGARLPYWRFLCWIVGLSATDLLGFSLRRSVEEAPASLRIASALLAGLAALDPTLTPGSGVMAAFGSVGALALLRVGMTAWAQALGTGQPLGGPLLLTAGAWLATRLAGWWSFDLLKGLSPVR